MERDGKYYYFHTFCMGKRPVCHITGLPIPLSSKYYLRDGLYFEAEAFKRSTKCQKCNYPLYGKYAIIKVGGKEVYYHGACINSSEKCEACRLPITGENKRIETFGRLYHYHKKCYENHAKCIVSGLPVVNMGNYTVNSRSNTVVLDKFKKFTKKCHSCGDQFHHGYLHDHITLCSYCHINSANERLGEILRRVKEQFRKNSVRPPDNISMALFASASNKLNENDHQKGNCVSSFNGGTRKYTHKIRIIPFLNIDIATIVIAHELGHAVINESLGMGTKISLLEGRCDFAAYTIGKQLKLPDYATERIRNNQVKSYRNEFLIIEKKRLSIRDVLSKRDI